MISGIWKDVYKLHANCMPFHIRNLSVDFGICRGSEKQFLNRQLYWKNLIKFTKQQKLYFLSLFCKYLTPKPVHPQIVFMKPNSPWEIPSWVFWWNIEDIKNDLKSLSLIPQLLIIKSKYYMRINVIGHRRELTNPKYLNQIMKIIFYNFVILATLMRGFHIS